MIIRIFALMALANHLIIMGINYSEDIDYYLSSLREGERFQFKNFGQVVTWCVYIRYDYSTKLRLGFHEYTDETGNYQRCPNDRPVRRYTRGF